MNRLPAIESRMNRGVLGRRLIPDEVAAVDDLQAACGQPRVEELDVGKRHHAVVAAVDERHGRRDLR